jgi:heptaprenyl diphosphate synthase
MTPSSGKLTTRDITQLGVLLAAAIALRLVEMASGYLLPIPGFRLGLANCVTIIVLYLYGTKRGALFLATRILITGLLFTGLFTPGFLIGLGGAVLSFLAMDAAIRGNWFSAVGVGVLGAFTHNCGQLIVAMFLMRTTAIITYLPVLIAIGIPTGLFTGTLAGIFLKRVSKGGTRRGRSKKRRSTR